MHGVAMNDRPLVYPFNHDAFPAGVHVFNPHKFPEFMPPYHFLQAWAIDVMYKPSSSTRFENYLATIAREELITCLLQDEHATPRFEEWMSNIGFTAIAYDISDYLNRVAQRRGLAHRGDIARVSPAPLTLIQDLLPEGYTLQDRLYEAYTRSREVLRTAWSYVIEDLVQQWRWLAYRLTHDLLLQRWEHAVGLKMHRDWRTYSRWLLSKPPLQPASGTIHWEAHLGESDAAVTRRVLAALKVELGKRQPIAMNGCDLKIGRVRADSEKHIPRWTRWLYRDLTTNGARYRLAQLHHETQHDCDGENPACHRCQAEVRYGIDRALTILSNTQK